MTTNYEAFAQQLRSEVPINRKEKFYSATILPSIFFQNGPHNFFAFLKLIKDFPSEINAQNTGYNFLFYTEYSLKQSAGPRSVGLTIPMDLGEIPDVLIEIILPTKALIVIEVKMFQNYPQRDFDNQMELQRNSTIRTIQSHLSLPDNRVFHLGIVPQKLAYKDRTAYQILNWEIFLSEKFNTLDNYFTDYLRFALENYEGLVETRQSKIASTVKKIVKGSELLKCCYTDDSCWVGRHGGVATITRDVRDGTWQNRKYSWNDCEPQDGHPGNWITGKDFAKIVESNSPNSKLVVKPKD